MIFPVMQYNMENMKSVYKFKKLKEMKLDDYGFGLFEYNGSLYFKEAEGERCFDVRSGNEVVIGKDKIVTVLEDWSWESLMTPTGQGRGAYGTRG